MKTLLRALVLLVALVGCIEKPDNVTVMPEWEHLSLQQIKDKGYYVGTHTDEGHYYYAKGKIWVKVDQ